MVSKRRYWLMKSEPDVYSIDDLQRDGVTSWEGVRNYQARNIMRDEMQLGDLVLFYHSNAKPPGVAGIGRICKAAHPDLTAQDKASPYYDAKASEENPIWMLVDVEFIAKFPEFVSLDKLKQDDQLAGMLVCKRGMRLSVQPVDARDFERVVALGNPKPSK